MTVNGPDGYRQIKHIETPSSLFVQKPVVATRINIVEQQRKKTEREAKTFAKQRAKASVALAQKELGKHVVENKASNGRRGNNHGPDITRYRGQDTSAPWCASFVNYVTSNAQGLGNLFGLDRNYDDNKQWCNASLSAGIQEAADQNGVFEKKGTYTPKPGDLIIWDRHIGIVEKVNPDGTFTTIEGNTDDALMRRNYNSIADAQHPKSNNGEYKSTNLTGFVNMEKYYEKYYKHGLRTGSKVIAMNA